MKMIVQNVPIVLSVRSLIRHWHYEDIEIKTNYCFGLVASSFSPCIRQARTKCKRQIRIETKDTTNEIGGSEFSFAH